MDSDSIRHKFLQDNADFLLDEFSAVLRGEGEFSCKSNVNLGRALTMLETLILNAEDKSKIKLNSLSDIVEGVKNGEISASQADKMLGLLKSKAEVEELEQSILLKAKMIGLMGDEDDS